MNHIHLEIGKGKQTKKVKINGSWQLQDLINIEDYFYIDETNIIKKKLYDFEIRYSKAEKIENEVINEMLSGFYELQENNLDIMMYAQKDGQRLGMISAAKNNSEYKVLKTLDKIDDDRVHYVKVNANYFQMGGVENGQHYGVEITPQVDLIPHQKEWLALWVVKGEKVIKFDNSTKFNLSKNDVEFACSPYAVLYHYGKDCDYVSSACGNKKSVKNTQTFLIQLNETKGYQVILGVVKNKCYPKEIVEWAKAKFETDLLHLSLYDSGGSSQLIVNGEKKLFTGRPIANALTLFKDDTSILKDEIKEIFQPKIVTVTIQQEEYETLKNKAGKYDEILKIIGGK